ncbi:MAG TPA: hypothetical protein VJ885_07565 [Thermoanaerobaculia bacterium]|nr:hypothetical protein [Thermoanaerobaculia bacterium]
MPKFTLSFKGLVLHIANEDGSRTAVLVNDHHHVPRLEIPSSVEVEEEGVGKGGEWNGEVTGDYREYDLKGRKVEIENVATSAVIVDSSFEKLVPKLQAILEGDFIPGEDDLMDEVRHKESKEAAAYVDYSGGTLSVLECFLIGASFVPPIAGDPRCIGQTILFAGSTTTGSRITIKDGLGNSLIVPDGTEIGIKNTAPGRGGHHLAYGRLLNSKKKPRPMVEDGECTACVHQKGAFMESKSDRTEQEGWDSAASLSIECSNSQWP